MEVERLEIARGGLEEGVKAVEIDRKGEFTKVLESFPGI